VPVWLWGDEDEDGGWVATLGSPAATVSGGETWSRAAGTAMMPLT
jgi:hypothetical protein